MIEKNQTHHQGLANFLRNCKFQVDLAENIKDGLYFLRAYNFDLILLEYLPKMSLNFIQQSKTIAPRTPIIILSKTYSKEAELESLQSGASDFLTHPLDLDILLARINVSLRLGKPPIINIGDLCIIPSEEYISFQNQIIDLKGKAFEVLSYLAIHQNYIISKEKLLDALWEEPKLVTPNVIEVIINQIRQKLDKPYKIQSIQTIRKKGYRFNLTYQDS